MRMLVNCQQGLTTGKTYLGDDGSFTDATIRSTKALLRTNKAVGNAAQHNRTTGPLTGTLLSYFASSWNNARPSRIHIIFRGEDCSRTFLQPAPSIQSAF